MTRKFRAIRGPLPFPALAFALVVASCDTPRPESGAMQAQAPTPPATVVARAENLTRVDGRIVPTPSADAGAVVREIGNGSTVGSLHTASAHKAGTKDGGQEDEGEITLNYVDTDIREIIRQILGTILKVNYSIEPGFTGQATIQTAHPLKKEELLPTLQTMLAQAGGTMYFQNGMFRIGPSGDEAVIPPMVDAQTAGAGSQVIPLRFASAKQLAAMLEPYVGEGAKILADPARNVLVVSGTAAARSSLVDLIRVFDVDYLAGQSYALFPVKSGDPAKVATDLQHALEVDADGPLAGSLSVIPIEQANAIMVIAKRPAYLDRAARLVAQLDHISDTAGRNMHVIYLKNVQAKDLQPVLQRAVNPSAGGGGETAPGSLPPTAEGTQIGTGGASSTGLPGSGGGIGTGQGAITGAAQGLGGGTGQQASAATPSTTGTADTGADLGQESTGGSAKGPQIIADTKSNALLVVATESEYAKIEAAVRRLDIMPLQVLIEATVAEVTLNHDLEYGTQFFLKNGKNVAILSNAANPSVASTSALNNDTIFNAAGNALAPGFPGFAVARTFGNAQVAIEALKTVTQVKVISSPKLLILDRQQATLQVGDLVPIITQSATSNLTGTAPTVNSVQYQPTGVILTVTPRINSGGLVTLDIDQEVSQVVKTTSSTIQSPTFQQRKVNSKVVIQDGETISLAGLIQDQTTNDNNGIPFLQDIPLLGALFSTRTNNHDRTELLVMITPHVVYDQHDARALTAALKGKLSLSASAAAAAEP